MRDPDMNLLFGRAGGAVQPDAEFEEDLLLRLEAAIEEPHHAAPNGLASELSVVGAESEVTGRASEMSHRRRGRWLAVAAAVVVTAGLAATALVVSRDSEPAAATLPVPDVTLAAPSRLGPASEAAFAEACRRWSGVLAEIDAAGSPLFLGLRPTLDEDVTAMADQLTAAVDEFVEAGAMAILLEPAIDSTLQDVASLLDSELVLVARGRQNGARTSFPRIVDGLISVSSDVAALGVDACGP